MLPQPEGDRGLSPDGCSQAKVGGRGHCAAPGMQTALYKCRPGATRPPGTPSSDSVCLCSPRLKGWRGRLLTL